jgi:hypothetical protein
MAAEPTTADLIAWLEKQPADATYHYSDPEGCVLAQFFRQHHDDETITVYGWGYGPPGVKDRSYPRFWAIAANKYPMDFGAALSRLRGAA